MPGTAFLVGLFSGIDVVSSMTPEELVSEVQLEDDVVEALVARRGGLGDLLRVASSAYEGDDGERVVPSVSVAEAKSYLESVQWAEELFSSEVPA